MSPWDASVERVKTTRELRPFERAVAGLVAEGHLPAAIAAALGITVVTARSHIADIAQTIPGDLPAWAKIAAWARGASPGVLGA